MHRLSRDADGGLLYRMKRPRHGSSWLPLTADELLAKLATLVPPPRVHAVRYHGVFAPHAGLRSRVVPEPPGRAAAPVPPEPPSPPPARALEDQYHAPPRSYRVPWADLLEKVFAIDVLACPECGGRLRLIAFIAEATVAMRILDHLDLDSTGPPVAPARGEPDCVEPAPDYDVADPVYQA